MLTHLVAACFIREITHPEWKIGSVLPHDIQEKLHFSEKDYLLMQSWFLIESCFLQILFLIITLKLLLENCNLYNTLICGFLLAIVDVFTDCRENKSKNTHIILFINGQPYFGALTPISSDEIYNLSIINAIAREGGKCEIGAFLALLCVCLWWMSPGEGMLNFGVLMGSGALVLSSHGICALVL
ncbi:hypothetical protein ACJX0J_014622, partial [Zea mays]